MVYINGYAVLEFYAFLLQQLDAAVDDGFVEFEVGDSVAEQSAGGFVLLEDSNLIAHEVQVVGSSEASRTGADDGHLLAVALDIGMRLDESFLEGHLCDGSLILAVGGGLVVKSVQHARLLAECRTDASRELWEGVGSVQQPIGQFPVTLKECIVPLWRFVAQRTGPVAERHAAVHAARGLQFAFAGVECLLDLAKVVDSIVNRTVARLLARHCQKSWRI